MKSTDIPLGNSTFCGPRTDLVSAYENRSYENQESLEFRKFDKRTTLIDSIVTSSRMSAAQCVFFRYL